VNLAGDDPEHAVVVPGGLLAPTAKAGLMAAIVGDEIAGGGAMAHPTVILAEGDVENPKAFSMLQCRRMARARMAGSASQLIRK